MRAAPRRSWSSSGSRPSTPPSTRIRRATSTSFGATSSGPPTWTVPCRSPVWRGRRWPCSPIWPRPGRWSFWRNEYGKYLVFRLWVQYQPGPDGVPLPGRLGGGAGCAGGLGTAVPQGRLRHHHPQGGRDRPRPAVEPHTVVWAVLGPLRGLSPLLWQEDGYRPGQRGPLPVCYGLYYGWPLPGTHAAHRVLLQRYPGGLPAERAAGVCAEKGMGTRCAGGASGDGTDQRQHFWPPQAAETAGQSWPLRPWWEEKRYVQ